MDSPNNLSLADQFAAACTWWQEAGVDHAFHDQATAWLKCPQEEHSETEASAIPAAAVAKQVRRQQVGGDRSGWPETLEHFRSWWLAEPSLDAGGSAPRIAPRGRAGANLMVIVPTPEAADADALLSGPQGRLLGNILRAMGIAPDRAYFASALARHTPLADWDELRAQGYADVLAHHIALAEPRRLLLMGRDILTLLDKDRRQGTGEITTDKAGFSYLGTFGLEAMLENARLRADLWRRWLDWTRDGQ